MVVSLGALAQDQVWSTRRLIVCGFEPAVWKADEEIAVSQSTMKYVDFAPCCFDFAKNDRPLDRQPGWERTTKGAHTEADARIAANALLKRSIARLSIGCRIQTLAASGR